MPNSDYANVMRPKMGASQDKFLRVMLADDHPLLMAGFASTLDGYGINVVGQARTPEEALKTFRESYPDVVVLDVRFAGKITGLDVGKQILNEHPGANIVYLSQFDSDSLIDQAYKDGARAFLTKDCDSAELAKALRQAAQGKQYFLPQIASRLAALAYSRRSQDISGLPPLHQRVLQRLLLGETDARIAQNTGIALSDVRAIAKELRDRVDRSLREHDDSPAGLLDERELTILKLVAKGVKVVDIAAQLRMSTKTVSVVTGAFKKKLDLHNAADIARFATKHGLIE